MDPLRIRPGIFVAVTGCKGEPDKVITPFGPVERNESFSGTPLKVLSNSPPFLLVTDGKERWSLDTRELSVCKVRKRYARAYYGDDPNASLALGLPCAGEMRVRAICERKANITKCPECESRVVDVQQYCPQGHLHTIKACTRCGWWKDLTEHG